MELWRKNLYILWGTQFLAMLGMNLVVPFLPFFVRELGVSDPDDLARYSGLVFAGPFILSLIFTPIWGLLGDRYGRIIELDGPVEQRTSKEISWYSFSCASHGHANN